MNDDKTMTSLRHLLRDGSLYHRAPPHLRARVEAALAGKVRRPWRLPWRLLSIRPVQAWAGGGVAGIAASALVFGVLTLGHPAQQGMLRQELVSSHVRALLSQHAMDVVSTDQHTVKPWFNGRLDYAPPVIVLPARDFPLVGGRVDYLGHRTVAVMVYRYQQHPIDLYVFPAASGSPTPAAYSADGYSIAHWHLQGMDFWAITDADPARLKMFVTAVQDKLSQAGRE